MATEASIYIASLKSNKIDMLGGSVINLADPSNDPRGLATKAYVDTLIGNNDSITEEHFVKKTGDTMTGVLAMGSNSITGVANPVADQDIITKNKTDILDAARVLKSGDSMSSTLAMAGNLVKGLPTIYPSPYNGDEAISWAQVVKLVIDNTTNNSGTPTGPNHLTNKAYVDNQDALRILKVGDTMSGALAMGGNLITGLADPVSPQDAVSKKNSDDRDAMRLSKTGDSMAGPLAMGGNSITGLANPTNLQDAAPKTYVDTSIASNGYFVRKMGDTMSGALTMSGNPITELANPTSFQDATTKNYVDAQDVLYILKAGDTLSGALAMGGSPITGLADPVNLQDAATKAYVSTTLNALVHAAGDTMSGALALSGNPITGLADPVNSQDASAKIYVDSQDSLRVLKTGDTMSGALTMGGNLVKGLPTTYPPLYNGNEAASWAQAVGLVVDSTTNNPTPPAGPYYLANKAYVDAQDGLRLVKAGDSMSGSLALGGNAITGVANPTNAQDATTKTYVDTKDALRVLKTGDTILGPLVMGGNPITGLANPASSQDAATKIYVDTTVSSGNFVRRTGDTMSGALSTPQVAIGTSTGGPEIDMVLGGTSSGTSLGYGLRVRRSDLLAHCQLTWDAAGFTVYRVDGSTAVPVCTIANGRLTALQDPVNPQDTATQNYVNTQDGLRVLKTGDTMTGSLAMSGNRITGLADPTNSQDVATKNYVGLISKQSFGGHIPPMSANSSQTGFVASTNSTFFNGNYQAFMAFSPQLVSSGTGNEWATNGMGAGAWIQIACPAAVRIWKIRLRGRSSNSERITSWNLQGSTGGAFTTLFTSNVILGATVQEFLISIPSGTAYSIYRLNVLAAEISNPGLSHFQIFTQKT